MSNIFSQPSRVVKENLTKVTKVLGKVHNLPSLEKTKIMKRLSVAVEESGLTSIATGMA